MPNQNRTDMDRREFLTSTGRATAMAAAVGAVAAQAQAKERKPVVEADRRAPRTGRLLEDDETIGIGIIGVGGMGTGHHKDFLLSEHAGRKLQVRAVSDVYNYKKARAQRIAKEIVERDIDAYTDYAELLSRDDIHAVVIATPDHWHAQASIDALEAGKDVYCQKPMTYTIEEALSVRDKVLETGRVFQCGAQQSSDDWWWQARKFWDYSGGVATDLIYHVMAPMTIALDAQAPERAVGSGGIYVQRDDREVPDTFMMTLDYPGDYTVVMTSCMANRQGLPPMIRGHRATIRPKDGGIHVTPEAEFKEWFKKEHGAEELHIPREPRLDHMNNWLDCIRTREQCHLDAETAYRAMAPCRMAVDSYRQDKIVFWDPQRERHAKRHPRPDRVAKFPVEKV
jgi:predicted dehydrogenase